MTRVRFSKAPKATIDKQSIVNGRIYISSDTKEFFCDTANGERIKICDIEVLDDDKSRTSLLAPLNKFYYVLDTKKLWYYNNDWNQIGPSNNLVIKANGTQLCSYNGQSEITINITKSSVGLGNVTNDRQIKGLSSGTTNGHVVTFGSDGYTVKDSGFTIGKSVPSDAKFTDTNTWIALKGATASAAGTAGYAPAPSAGASNRYLRSDGTWSVPPDTNTTYPLASASANGLMSSSDKSKLDGIASGANKYIHPSYTARSSGLYKITVDGSGHVSTVSAVTKSDITALGIPGQDTDTTYDKMTGATTSEDGKSGLVPVPTKGANNRYLRSDGTWSVPPDTNTTYTLGSFGITASATEINYIKGVTSSIQTQLNGKAASSHTHSQYYDSSVSRNKNTVLAAPNGSNGAATFRALVAADIPALTKSKISDFPSSMPASDVYSWAKASTKPSYSKSEVGLGNVDNTADANKSVKYATSAGSASSATKATNIDDGVIS